MFDMMQDHMIRHIYERTVLNVNIFVHFHPRDFYLLFFEKYSVVQG